MRSVEQSATGEIESPLTKKINEREREREKERERRKCENDKIKFIADNADSCRAVLNTYYMVIHF